MSSEKISGITKRIILITAVVYIAFLLFDSLTQSINNWLNQNISADVGLSGTAIRGLSIVILLSLLFSRLLKRGKLTPQEYTILYATIAVGLVVNDGWTFEKYFIAPYLAAMGMEPMKSAYIKFWKPWFAPSWNEFEPALFGGAIPPPSWLLPIIFWGIAVSSAALYCMSSAMILRKRWIDEEKVTFPYAIIPATLIQMATISKEEKGKLNKKLILIAMLAGFLWRVPDFVGSIAPAIFPPPPPGWPRVPAIFTGSFTMDLRTSPPGPWNEFFQSIPNAHFNINLHPTIWILGLIMPANLLLTVGLTWVMTYAVIPAILTYAGLIPNYSAVSQDSNWGIFAYINGWLGGGNIYMPIIALETYGAIAMSVFYLWTSRSYLKDVFRRVLHSTRDELETECMSYRSMFILMCITGLIMFFVIVIGFGAPIQTGILSLIAVQLLGLAYSRIRGEIGWGGRWFTDASIGIWYWWPGFGTPGYFQSGLNTSLSDMTPEFFGNQAQAMLYYGWNNKETTFGPMGVTFEAFKLASMTNTRPKDIIKFMIIGYILACFIILPIKIIYIYSWGAQNLPGTRFNVYSEGQWVGWWFDPAWQGRQPWPWWQQAIAGFIVIGIIMFLHMKFLWFPFTAAGVVLGGSEVCNWSGFGWAALGIWAVKVITFRLVGSEKYEKWIVPFVVGWVAGWMLSHLVIAIIWMARNLGFIVPIA